VTMKRRFEEGDVYFDALTRSGSRARGRSFTICRHWSGRARYLVVGQAHGRNRQAAFNDPTRRRASSSAKR